MIIFIKNVRITFKKIDEKVDVALFNQVFEKKEMIDIITLRGDVLIVGSSPLNVEKMLVNIQDNSTDELLSVTFLVADPKVAFENMHDDFKLIKAAGGLVEKNGLVLMIYRLGKWDFPKGKMESGETMKETAVREVEEECCVNVSLGKKICHTYHTYPYKERKALKKTNWYFMNLVEDKYMKPQTEEGIEKIEWVPIDEIKNRIGDSYASLNYLVDRYLEEKNSVFKSKI